MGPIHPHPYVAYDCGRHVAEALGSRIAWCHASQLLLLTAAQMALQRHSALLHAIPVPWLFYAAKMSLSPWQPRFDRPCEGFESCCPEGYKLFMGTVLKSVSSAGNMPKPQVLLSTSSWLIWGTALALKGFVRTVQP